MSGVARFFNLERTVAIVVLGIASWQLLLPPGLGLADNGDFARIMVRFDLTHAPREWGDRYFGFLNSEYVFDREEAVKYARPDSISSESVFVAAALAVNRMLGKTSFDLLLLGAVHVVVFAGGVYFLLLATRGFAGSVRTTAIILATLVFMDISYIAYFNSFYSESASFLFFLILTGCAYRAIASTHHQLIWTLAYFAAASAFLLAKYQNLVLLPVFLFFGWLLMKRQLKVKYFHLYLAAALMVSYIGYWFYLSAPAEDAVLYNSVFNGVLADSPTPGEDLAAFGLAPELARYAGSSAYSQDSLRYNSEFMREFQEKVTVGRVFTFYTQRPTRLIAVLDRTAGLAAQTRPALGNYPKAAGRPPGTQSKSWAMWSSIRSAVLPGSLIFALMVAAVYLALLAKRWVGEKQPAARLSLEWSALIAAMAGIQLALISMADGIYDVTKHAFLFNMFLDYMLVAIAAQGLAKLAGPAGEVQQEGPA